MANAQTLTGRWNEIKGDLRKRWGQLTDSDLQEFNGNVDELVGTIQRKTGESRESIEAKLDEIVQQGEGRLGRASAVAGEYAKRAGASMTGAYGRAAGSFRSGYAGTESTIRRNPGSAVAAAFGVGLLVGLMIGISSNGD